MIKLALGFTLGAWCLQQQAALPSVALMLFLIACLIGLYQLTRRFTQVKFNRKIALAQRSILFCLAIALGFTWATLYAHYRLNESLPAEWERQNITLVGVVASIPKTNSHGERFAFDVERVLTNGAVVPSHISLSYYQQYFSTHKAPQNSVKPIPSLTTEHLDFNVGERWQLTVRLKRPHTTYNPHGFDFESWALSENMRATGAIHLKSGYQKLSNFVWRPSYLVHHVRALIAARIDLALADKAYAGVIRALVIGDDSQITQQNWQAYLNTGTNHLMSISGLHITMLAGLAYGLVNWLWRRSARLAYVLPTQKAASIAGMGIALLYAALAGFSVPTQRTLYMLMTVAIMLLIGRKLSFTQVLSTALLVVVVLDPWSVTAAGFWLSFGAVAVIVFATSGRLAPAHWLLTAIKTQWAVTIGLIPILVMLFGQFSLVSPVANAFAIPLISFAVVPPAIFGGVFNIEWIMQLAHMVLNWSMVGLNWLAQLPHATWQQQAPPVWIMLLALFAIAWHLLPKGVPFRYLVFVCVLPLFTVKTTQPAQGFFKVTVLDVGQGLSTIVQTANHTLLYDAGSSFSAQSDAGSRVIVPFLRGEGIQQIDGLVVSHDDIDHAGGVPSVLNAVPVSWVLSSLDNSARLFSSHAFQQHRPARNTLCRLGEKWEWDAVTFEVLYPTASEYGNANTKDNNKSCVLKISSAHGAILLAGDVEKHAEYAMVAALPGALDVDVLVVPHHGSKTSSTADFIAATDPLAVVVSNGYLNRFGHPKAEVMARYQANDSDIYRSDYDGAVQIEFDHQPLLNVIRWRKAYPKYWHDDYSQ